MLAMPRTAARTTRRRRQDGGPALRQLRAEVWTRDRGLCRACQTSVLLDTDFFARLMHAHHIKFRSLGGLTVLENLVSLCESCHSGVHLHLLDITGDPNGELAFVKRDRAGRVVKDWRSPCPG